MTQLCIFSAHPRTNIPAHTLEKARSCYGDIFININKFECRRAVIVYAASRDDNSVLCTLRRRTCKMLKKAITCVSGECVFEEKCLRIYKKKTKYNRHHP